MEAYSIDLRRKVLAAYDRGVKANEIAENFGHRALEYDTMPDFLV